jgi:hypothetical protein
MDRDQRISDRQYLIRKAIFDACVDASHMEHDWQEAREEMYLDLADPKIHFLAFQYSMEGKGSEWASLGADAVALIERLSNDEYWYTPHYVIDLDTGLELKWTTVIEITGHQSAYEELVTAANGDDQASFLGIVIDP